MTLKIKKLSFSPSFKSDDILKYTDMGSVYEIQYMKFRPDECPILPLPMQDGKKRYAIRKTGEIKDCIRHDTRADSYKSLKRTFKRLRELINTNVSNPLNCRWITLTYAENMTDPDCLYHDFEKFNKRFQYWLSKQGYSPAQYIVVPEPQGRGAWHMHLIYIWDNKAPYIANDQLAKLWRHGFVKITALKDCDNVGAYLTAYLTDLEVNASPDCSSKDIKIIESNGTKKAILKGGRLSMYPAGMRLYRCSRGIQKPVVKYLDRVDAEGLCFTYPVQYESCFEIKSDDYYNIVHTRQYNRNRWFTLDQVDDDCPFVENTQEE